MKHTCLKKTERAMKIETDLKVCFYELKRFVETGL